MNRVLFITLAITIGCVSVFSGDPVPGFHYDNHRTGRTETVGPGQPDLVWTFRASGSLTASPVVGEDGAVYIASTDAKLYALNPDGSLRWTFQADESIFGTPAISPDGNIVFGDLSGQCYAVNPAGDRQWVFRIRTGTDRRFIAAPLIDDNGKIFVGAWDEYLYALAPDGVEQWKVRLGGLISSSPVLDREGNVYAACKSGRDLNVTKLKNETSQKLWFFSDNVSNNDRIISSPAIDVERNRLYIACTSTSNGYLYALDLESQQQAWRKRLEKGSISSPAIASDGTIYLGLLGCAWDAPDQGAMVYAVEPAGGTTRWTYQVEGYYILGSPSVDGDGTVYIGDSDGILYALSPQGQELWRYETQANIESSPVVSADGVLYVTSHDSTVYAFKTPAMVKEWLNH